MNRFSKYLGPALGLAFFLIAFVTLMQSQPEKRDRYVYTQLKPYIPYRIEKKMSGLRIRDTRTGEKIEPANTEVYHVLDRLEKQWGKRHLRLEGMQLIVRDDKNATLATIPLQNEKQRAWVRHFFSIP